MVKEKADAQAEEKPKNKVEDLKATLIKEAGTLGIKLPRTSISGFKSKKPEDIEKEKVRVEKDLILWLQTVIAAAKAEAKLKPIDKRRALLISRMRAVKARARAHTYSDANIKAWLEELAMIDSNPKSWNKITKSGTVNFTPGNKRKRTARDILDEMDLEDKDEEV